MMTHRTFNPTPLRGFAGVLVLCAQPAIGDVREFDDPNRDQWFANVTNIKTADFTGFAPGTFITDQYADLGVIFTDGNDAIHESESFVNDGWGLDGNDAIHLSFDEPQRFIAADYPGLVVIELFRDGRLIYTADDFPLGGAGHFAGLISPLPFDTVIVTDPFGEVEIDDLHFGTTPLGDLDLDGGVNANDLVMLLGTWGPCPPPVDVCPWNLDNEVQPAEVGPSDLIILLGEWGKNPGSPADFDGDGVVGPSDLIALLGAFGDCPDPPVYLCPSDLDCDDTVGPSDLVILLGNWGGS